jgi:hypothetical protein
MIDNVDHSDHNSRLARIGERLLASFPHLDLIRRRLVLVERHLVIYYRQK